MDIPLRIDFIFRKHKIGILLPVQNQNIFMVEAYDDGIFLKTLADEKNQRIHFIVKRCVYRLISCNSTCVPKNGLYLSFTVDSLAQLPRKLFQLDMQVQILGG